MPNHQTEQPNGYRWVMLTVYVLMGLGLWSAWFAQAPLLEQYWAQPPLSISVRWVGLLLSLPGLVAIILGVLTGRWVDTIGVRKMMILSGVLGSIAFGLRPLFPASFLVQAMLTVLAGYGVCILTACLPATMIQWFGPEKGHTYIGIGAGSYFVGSGLGVLVTANIFGSLGAKGVFTVWAIVMVAVTIIWVIFARDKAEAGSTARRVAFGREIKNVMQTGSAWLMLAYGAFISGATLCAMQYLPGQMTLIHHLPPALAGFVVGIFSIAEGIGFAVLPALAGRVGKKRISVILCSITLAIWIIYMVVPNWTVVSLLIFAVGLGFFFQAPWATGLALLESLPGVTPANVGVAAGLWTMSINTGVTILPVIFGSILASTGGIGSRGGLWAILIIYGVGLLVMLAARDDHVMEVETSQ